MLLGTGTRPHENRLSNMDDRLRMIQLRLAKQKCVLAAGSLGRKRLKSAGCALAKVDSMEIRSGIGQRVTLRQWKSVVEKSQRCNRRCRVRSVRLRKVRMGFEQMPCTMAPVASSH